MAILISKAVEGDMMLKHITIAALLIVALLVAPVGALASNITDALYYGNILVSNNGTAATNVSTVCTINGTALQNIYGVDTDFENVAIRNSSGADVPFMPGVNATVPWSLFVPSIGQSSSLNYIMYTGDSSLNATRYIFTDDDGMTIADDATMEGGDNCTATFTDTFIDINTEAPLFQKNTVYLGPDNSGNLVFGLEVNEAKNFNMEIDGGWTGAEGAQSALTPYEGQYCWTVTSALNGKYASQALDWDDSYKGASFTVAGWVKISSGFNSNAHIDIYDGVGTTSSNATVSSSYQYLSVTRVLNAAATQLTIRLFLTNTHGSSRTAYFDSLTITPDNWTDIDYGTPILSATATTGEHDVILDLNTVNATLTVDGAVVDTAALGGASIPDNPVDWQIGSASTPYIGGFNFAVDGDDVCTIEWEYDTTFTDLSGNGNDATPAFRTTASDAEVSATLMTFAPIDTAIAPAYTVEDAPTFITENITMTGQFTTGNVSSSGGPAGFQLVNDVAESGGVPNIVVWCIIALCITSGLGLFMSWFQRRYGFRSMWVNFIAGILPIAVLVALGGDVKVFDFWMVVFYIAIFLCLMVFSRHGDLAGNVSTHGLIGFLAQSWIGLTIINKFLEGNFIGSAETSWVNTFAFTQTFKLFGIFSIPVINLDFFTKGIPSLLRWDYSFFGGNAQMFQYLMYSLSAVVAFIIFGLIIGLLYNFFRGR